jgi:hypothetical protein
MRLLLLFSFLISSACYGQNYDLKWAGQLGSTSQRANDIATDSQNNIIITGSFIGTLKLDMNVGPAKVTTSLNSDIFVAKYTQNGELIWFQNYNSSGQSAGLNVEVDQYDNIYLSGAFSGTADFDYSNSVFNLTSQSVNPAKRDIYILKLESNGNFIWAKRLGGNMGIRVSGMVLDSDNSVYTAGDFIGTIDFNPNSGVHSVTPLGTNIIGYILKLDSNGNFVWVDVIDGIGGGSRFHDLAIDFDQNLIGIGLFSGTCDFDSGAGIYDFGGSPSGGMFAMKVKNDGAFDWAISADVSAYEVGLDHNGSILIGGIFNGTVDFDPGIDTVYHTCEFFQDAFLLKLDSSGGYVWSGGMSGGTLGNSYGPIITHILSDDYNNMFVMGNYHTATTDIDPGIDTLIPTHYGETDLFLMKLNQDNSQEWVRTFGGPEEEYSNRMTLDTDGNLNMCGRFQGTADLDPDSTVFNLTVNTYDEIYIVQLGDCNLSTEASLFNAGIKSTSVPYYPNTTYDWLDCDNNYVPSIPSATEAYYLPAVNGNYAAKVQSGACIAISNCVNGIVKLGVITIYPNPVSDILYVDTKELVEKMKVYSCSGELMLESMENFIDVTLLREGFYFLEIMTNKGKYTRNFVKY